jgi:hypothetical protein
LHDYSTSTLKVILLAKYPYPFVSTGVITVSSILMFDGEGYSEHLNLTPKHVFG